PALMRRRPSAELLYSAVGVAGVVTPVDTSSTAGNRAVFVAEIAFVALFSLQKLPVVTSSDGSTEKTNDCWMSRSSTRVLKRKPSESSTVPMSSFASLTVSPLAVGESTAGAAGCGRSGGKD